MIFKMFYKNIFVPFFLLVFNISIFAQNVFTNSIVLPVKRVKITSTFGESRKDHFHNGVDFGGGEQSIYAIKDGIIIYYFDKSEFPFVNYPGSGNFVVIQHKNFRSYYMHLKDNSINKTNMYIKKGEVIGITSDTGHSYGIHLHFGIEKIYPKEVLNPLMFFRNLIQDKISPKIYRFYIKVDDSDLIPVYQSYSIISGKTLSFFLETYDFIRESSNRMGIYKILFFVNNELIREYKFDKLKVKNNKYYLPPYFSFEDVFYDKYIYRLGKIPIEEKNYNIRIDVEDFFGNKKVIKRHLKVK